MYVIFFDIGMALILGGIISKEYRIYRIFSNRSALAVDFSDLKLFLIVAVIFVYFGLIAVFTIVTGLEARVRQSSSNPLYLYVRCSYSSAVWNNIVIVVEQVSLFLFRVLALYLAWCTRKVTSSYSESRSVFAVVAIFLCLNIIFVPLFLVLVDGTNSALYRTVVRLIDNCIIITATLMLLFYHRFWLVYSYEKNKKGDNYIQDRSIYSQIEE